ncbi:hypothetical protein [Salimicrobium salexigens]|nr:hypothetical protein [Salimicrobium salexigens]
MKDVVVKMFPAKNGDCFLVSLGTKNKKHILIDCGYVETYRQFLKKELLKIAAAGEAIDLIVSNGDKIPNNNGFKFPNNNR